MTRILTICSGCAGTGKTHLGVNLALELVRRGRQVGVYHRQDGASPVDRFIDIRALEDRRQEAAGGKDHAPVIVRGYLGIDILSFDLPLAEWRNATPVELQRGIHQFNAEDGYDDLIIDTSGLGPREQLACCLAAPVVMLVLTPDPATHSEAFALLRILQLNGFSGQLRLLVNRVSYAVDATEIYETFANTLRQHLDMEAGALEVLVRDECVPKSEHYRQAFSAVFPDAEASAGIVVIVDDMETLRNAGSEHAIEDYWEAVRACLCGPLYLPGGATLDAAADAVPEKPVTATS